MANHPICSDCEHLARNRYDCTLLGISARQAIRRPVKWPPSKWLSGPCGRKRKFFLPISTSEAKSCIKCASAAKMHDVSDQSGPGFLVVCTECNERTLTHRNEGAAYKDWNTK